MKPDALRTLDVEALITLRQQVDSLLSEKRSQLERMLSQINGETPVLKRQAVNRGTKVAAQYRSKKNPGLQWSGRGVLPKWMREEIKGTKLKKEDFRIS
jgi:DNA-binding protein H-NS